jgi:hypothetical protein
VLPVSLRAVTSAVGSGLGIRFVKEEIHHNSYDMGTFPNFLNRLFEKIIKNMFTNRQIIVLNKGSRYSEFRTKAHK